MATCITRTHKLPFTFEIVRSTYERSDDQILYVIASPPSCAEFTEYASCFEVRLGFLICRLWGSRSASD